MKIMPKFLIYSVKLDNILIIHVQFTQNYSHGEWFVLFLFYQFVKFLNLFVKIYFYMFMV